MAGGLALIGIVAYAAAASGLYQAIAHTPLIWVVILAPLAFVLILSFGIERMSAGTTTLLFWIYASEARCLLSVVAVVSAILAYATTPVNVAPSPSR